ncbi:MAG: response regulator [Candidatus Eiseniibacteriota bacterium]
MPAQTAEPQGPLEVLSWVFAAVEPGEGARYLLNGLLGAYGVSGGLVALRAGDSARILASRGLPGGWITSWEAQSSADVRARLQAGLLHERLHDPPGHIDSVLKRSGVTALLTLPLGPVADPDGALVLASTSESPFGPPDRRALETFAAAFASWLANRLARGEPEPVLELTRDAGAAPQAADADPSWGVVPFARLGGDGRVTVASRAFGRLLGIRPEALVGREPGGYLAPPDVARLLAAVDRVRVEGAVAVPAARTVGSAEPSAAGPVDIVLTRGEGGLLLFAFPAGGQVAAVESDEVSGALAEQSDLAIVRVDRDGKVAHWPRRATRILGWGEEEVRGRPLDLVFAGADRPVWERLRRERGTTESSEWPVVLRTNDGESVPCAVRLLFLEDNQETLFVLRDRRVGEAAEQWLRWSRALLSVLGASTLVLDSGGRIRELGEGWERDPGAVSDWLGRHVAELFESDRREVLAALRETARDGDWTGTLVSRGSPLGLRLRAVRGSSGNLEAIVGARLPRDQGEIRKVFHKIPVGIILVDARLRILELNPELATMCGMDALPADPLGLDVRSLAIFQTREAQSALDGLREGRCFETQDMPLRTPAEEPVVVRMRANELSDEGGRPSGYVLTILAASGDTQMERLLIRAQKMESIGSFASGLAHDFGNFVSVILGKAGVLRVKLPDDPHIVGELDDIETAAKRAQHLAQELMKFARGGRNRVVALQLNRLIQEVSSLIRTSVGKKIELEYVLDDSICTVEGDEVELQQLILNLCLNARDAMPGGGRLTLETKPLSTGELARLPGGEATAGVMLRIRDTGVGMSREVSERIFEPFFSTKKEQAGTGLGLAMAYGIVRRHHGTIDVQSAPGRGTTFEIALPAPTGGTRPFGRPILVVDDEPAFREMVRLVLEEDGYEVHLAANGVEALRRLREEYASLGLVILDLRMPGVDGLGVLHELRELAPDLPVLVATGYATAEEKRRALAAGAGKVLEKPYRVSDLRAALGELIGHTGDHRRGGLTEAGS